MLRFCHFLPLLVLLAVVVSQLNADPEVQNRSTMEGCMFHHDEHLTIYGSSRNACNKNFTANFQLTRNPSVPKESLSTVDIVLKDEVSLVVYKIGDCKLELENRMDEFNSLSFWIRRFGGANNYYLPSKNFTLHKNGISFEPFTGEINIDRPKKIRGFKCNPFVDYEAQKISVTRLIIPGHASEIDLNFKHKLCTVMASNDVVVHEDPLRIQQSDSSPDTTVAPILSTPEESILMPGGPTVKSTASTWESIYVFWFGFICGCVFMLVLTLVYYGCFIKGNTVQNPVGQAAETIQLVNVQQRQESETTQDS